MVCEEEEPVLSDVEHGGGNEHLCACHFQQAGGEPGSGRRPRGIVTLGHRLLAGLLAVPLLTAGCGDVGPATPPPVGSLGSATPAPSPSATDRPFARVAWPTDGSACGDPGYTGLLGRVEALNPRNVRFVLCEPDGAFPARLAHPALGIVDSTSVDRVAADPGAARSVPGAGSFRVDAWTDGDNVRLTRVQGSAGAPAESPAQDPSTTAPGSPAPAEPPPLVVMRWAASAAARAGALREAEVDGIDAPDDAAADELDTLPEIVQLSRPGLVTAYLGFGAGRPFGGTAVRRAFAQALDHAALARDAFPAGSVAATHLAPCEVPAGCAGLAWYDVNGPAAAAALDLAELDRKAVIPLHVPDGAIPGLPDPAGLAAAIRDQLAESIDVTVEIDAMPPDALAAAIADGSIDGLYLGAVASSLADPAGFLEPLFGEDAADTVAARRAKGVPAALEDVAVVTDPELRAASFAAINDAIRAAVPVVPLVHAGSLSAYRADVDRRRGLAARRGPARRPSSR